MPVVDGTGNVSSENLRAEMEFSWELYLEEMNAFAVPPSAFQHVSHPLSGMSCIVYTYEAFCTQSRIIVD